MHGGRLPAGKALRAIPASGGFHVCQPDAAALDRGAEDLGQYQTRADHAPKIFWKVGVLGDYRKGFWKFEWSRLRHGDIESLISGTLIAHPLSMFARAA